MEITMRSQAHCGVATSGRRSSAGWACSTPISCACDLGRTRLYSRHPVIAALARSATASQPSSTSISTAALVPYTAPVSQRHNKAEESYDETAAPLHASVIGSRIADDMVGGHGTFDGNNYDAADWEEVSSLISFDAEEHKYVTRYMPKERQRVEDMMGSFDGDDFDAVMRAAKGGEPSAERMSADEAALVAASASATSNSSAGTHASAEDLFLAVCRRRAAALAAEQQSKKNPKPRRRKVPLAAQPSEAWLYQVPTTVVGVVQHVTEAEYKAAQRAVLPPLSLPKAAGAGTAGLSRRSAGVVAAAAASPAAVQKQSGDAGVLVVLLPRSEANPAAAAPASHAVQQQVASPSKPRSSSSRAAGRPAAVGTDAVAGLASAGAATVSTKELDVRGVDRQLAQSAVAAAPLGLAAATAAGGAQRGASGLLRARQPLALPSSDDEDQLQGSSAVYNTAGTHGQGKGSEGRMCVANRRAGSAALKRALAVLRNSSL